MIKFDYKKEYWKEGKVPTLMTIWKKINELFTVGHRLGWIDFAYKHHHPPSAD